MLEIVRCDVEKLKSVQLFQFGQEENSIFWRFDVALSASAIVVILPAEVHAIAHALSARAQAVSTGWKLLVTANFAFWGSVSQPLRDWLECKGL